MNCIFLPRFFAGVLGLTWLALMAAAQSPAPAEQAAASAGEGMWYALTIFALVGGGLAMFLWRRSRNGGDRPASKYENRYQIYDSGPKNAPPSIDAEKELEWLRKAKRSKPADGSELEPRRRMKITATNSAGIDESTLDTNGFQQKMLRLQYALLPINSVTALAPASTFDPLPISDDPALLDAIEQINDEYEDDVEIRGLALRILAAFRTRNAVEALSQIALYDLSSQLRSRAVAALTDFDHESVFESILLAGADPTREVRAAAAKGLFKLNFGRADALKRIIETRDGFRVRHAGRAARDSGIAEKAFERLIHEDSNVAYEAIVLVALMIEADETRDIFEAIRGHKDERVRYALLHVLKLVGDDRTVEPLSDLSTDETLPADVLRRVNEVVNAYEHVAA